MPGKSTLAIPLILLALLGGLSHWIDRTVRLPAESTAAQMREPVSIIEDFRALKTGPDGQPRYRLVARKLKHFNNDQPSELIEPRFSQQTETGGTTHVDARSAVVSPDGNTVTLEQAVHLERNGLDGAGGLKLSTERLVVHPDLGQVVAPGRVELSTDLWHATAGRMELDSHSRTVKLSGRVRAVYHHVSS